MSRRRPPSAFSTPISRVRWVTETSMMFISPTPPMPSVSVPMKASRICRPVVMIWNCFNCFIMLKTKTARLSSGLKLYCWASTPRTWRSTSSNSLPS